MFNKKGGAFMNGNYIKQALRSFFGFCLILVGAGLLFYNLFVLSTGFDTSMLLLDALLLLGGILLVAYGVSALSPRR